MKIIKKAASSVPREDAHAGAGGRRLYLDKAELGNKSWQAMTYGYLPAGGVFDWHEHENTDETMLVLKGSGTVADSEGEYTYNPGDLFIFPANTKHKINNPSTEEHEFIFVRIKTSLT